MPRYDYIVAADGTGDFLTVQEAVDACNRSMPHWWQRLWHIFRPFQVGIKSMVHFQNCTFEASQDAAISITGKL